MSDRFLARTRAIGFAALAVALLPLAQAQQVQAQQAQQATRVAPRATMTREQLTARMQAISDELAALGAVISHIDTSIKCACGGVGPIPHKVLVVRARPNDPNFDRGVQALKLIQANANGGRSTAVLEGRQLPP